MNAQDITGDWYGIRQAADSLLVTLHIYKDHDGLKGIMDSPSQGAFGIPMDEITLEEDTLFFRISTVFLKYKGYVNSEYSKMCGEVNQFGHVLRLDFSRKKTIRIIPVNDNSMTTVPAQVRFIETRTSERIPYTGIKRVKAGIPKVVQIDTSRLKILTLGKSGVGSPIVYKLPEPKPKDEFFTQEGWKWSPTIIKVKQTKPFPAQPIRMKEAAICNIQYLDLKQGLIDPEIWSMLEDSKGNMWFGSYLAGICKYDGKAFAYYSTKEGLTNNGIRAMIEDRSGNIWIGTNWGLCKYDGNYFTQYALVELFRTILSVLESGDGDIWIGTQDVGVIEKKGNFCIQYTENEGLTNNTVRSVIEDRHGNLWFGTDQGVCKFNGVTFTHFTENEGLISNKVRSIIEDRQGNLWFGTEQGVSKYDGIAFRQYTENEGLSINYINSIIEDKNGYLWFPDF
jgi:streptogramin lyase